MSPIKEIPSMDAWLKEAKAHPDADKVGMYLTHNGVVRPRVADALQYLVGRLKNECVRETELN